LVVLVLAAMVVGIMTVVGAPLLAIPIILLLPGPIIMLEVLRRQYRARQIKRFRDDAQARKIGFDSRDRETLSR
jgi:Flp pilus assembly protein TadB